MITQKKARYLTGLKNYSNFLFRHISAVFNFFFDQSNSNFAINKKMGSFKDCRAHSDDGTNYGASFNYRHMILLSRVMSLGSAGMGSLSRAAFYNLNDHFKHAWQSSFKGCYVWARLGFVVSVGPILTLVRLSGENQMRFENDLKSACTMCTSFSKRDKEVA